MILRQTLDSNESQIIKELPVATFSHTNICMSVSPLEKWGEYARKKLNCFVYIEKDVKAEWLVMICNNEALSSGAFSC